MRIYDIIDKKRHSKELTSEEIEFVISGYMKGEIEDYQVSSLLMAICINSMTKEETYHLTKAMLNSGEILSLSKLGDKTVDKHSTGGIGDKTTLIVAPIVASLGAKVAKMSGRGLGFTGGTIDKLESISGFKTELSANEFISQVEKIGLAVIQQSESLVPADKRLYALRDVTATIESIPLIASSIMSKKLASGSKSIVLDVKVGSGAFMKTIDNARALANAMIDIGKGFGRSVTCVISNMDVPLGLCVGNKTEIWEAIEVLSGRGERNLKELCFTVSASMISSAFNIDYSQARKKVENAVFSGSALAKFCEWIEAQGGDVSEIKNSSLLLNAKYKREIYSKESGYISGLDAQKIGTASMSLGAGRIKKGDKIDYSAGVVLNRTYGARVERGELLATFYSSSEELINCDSTYRIFFEALTLSDEKPREQDLIYEILK